MLPPETTEKSVLITRLAQLREPWRSVITPYALDCASGGVFLDPISGSIFVGHRPEAGIHNFAIILAKPVSNDALRQYALKAGFDLPQAAISLLQEFNGGKFYELSIRAANIGSFHDRYPFNSSYHRFSDIGFGYSIKTRGVNGRDGQVVFASRNRSLDNNVEYVQPTGTEILGLDTHGERRQFGRWDNLDSWFSNELHAAAEFTNAWCAAYSEMLRAHPRPTRHSRRPR